MAISHNEIQVTWSGSNSTALSGSSSLNSDTASLSSTSIQSQIEFKADHSGTPASGDTVDWYVLQSLGDPDSSGSNEFPTNNHGVFSGTLDLNADDPAISTKELPLPAVSMKVRAENNSSESVTISATILEQTG